MNRVEMLHRSPLFKGMVEGVLEDIAGSLEKRTFARGMVLFHKGSAGQRLYLIESGQVRIFVLSDGGREITLNIHGSGESFGALALLDGGLRSAGAVAMERTVVHTLERQLFLALVDAHPTLVRHALDLASQRQRHLIGLLESLAFQDIIGRVASCLLDLAAHHGQPGEQGIVLPMHLTQSELASYVVATRESVNKALGVLRDEGLVRHEGQVVTILDPAGLQRKVAW